MQMLTRVSLTLVALLAPSIASADISSTYTKLDFEKGCEWEKPASEEEANMGGSAICKGFSEAYPVYFAEGDLRQFVAFGPANEEWQTPGGFAQFNSVNTTIEWRLDNGKPFATILRWFVEIPKNDSTYHKGQVLVVSTVADPEASENERRSCVVGYVDARANKNANVLARKVADDLALDFLCGEEQPKFHGKRGRFSGTPNDLAN